MGMLCMHKHIRPYVHVHTNTTAKWKLILNLQVLVVQTGFQVGLLRLVDYQNRRV